MDPKSEELQKEAIKENVQAAHTAQESQTSLILLLGRIDGKLDSALSRISSHDVQLNELQKEINLLNRWKSYTIGAITIISVVSGLVANRIASFIFGAP